MEKKINWSLWCLSVILSRTCRYGKEVFRHKGKLGYCHEQIRVLRAFFIDWIKESRWLTLCNKIHLLHIIIKCHILVTKVRKRNNILSWCGMLPPTLPLKFKGHNEDSCNYICTVDLAHAEIHWYNSKSLIIL